MEFKESQVNSIITKAKELGLTCKITNHSTWKINCKNNQVLAQTDTGWLLTNTNNVAIFMPNFMVFEYLENLSR